MLHARRPGKQCRQSLRRVIGHDVESDGRIFCSAHCASVGSSSPVEEPNVLRAVADIGGLTWVGLAHGLQQLFADAGDLQSVDTFGPNELWLKIGATSTTKLRKGTSKAHFDAWRSWRRRYG